MNLTKIKTITEAIKWLDIKKYTYTVQYLNYSKPPIGLSSLNNKEDNTTLPARAITVIFSQNIYTDKDIAEHIEQVTYNLDIDRIAFLPDNRIGPYDGGYMVENLSPLYSEDKNTFHYCTDSTYGSFYLTLAEINKPYVGKVVYVEVSALGEIQTPEYHRVSCRIVSLYDNYLVVEINGVPSDDLSYKVYKINYTDFV